MSVFIGNFLEKNNERGALVLKLKEYCYKPPESRRGQRQQMKSHGRELGMAVNAHVCLREAVLALCIPFKSHELT